MVGFNVRVEQLSEQTLTIWDSSLRIIRRHAITIFIHHGRDEFEVEQVLLNELDLTVWDSSRMVIQRHYSFDPGLWG